MKVGDYVRTDKGYITKISDFTEHYTKGKRLGFKEEVIENFLLLDDKQCEIIESIDYSIPPCYPSDEELEKIKSHIIKSSPNIIDLIEVGDVLSFQDKSICRVLEITDNGYYLLKDFGGEQYYERKEWIEDFTSIVTKEQFESMEYKIGE